MSTLRKDLRAIAADGAASSLMVGIGENYLPAFVLALTASQVACGLAATVPLVIGSVIQLVSPYAIRRWGSHRRWVVLCAALQAVVFLPLVWAATNGSMPILLVFTFASLYWATGYAGGPAWNAWVGTLIPERIRASYLARRTRLAQIGVLVGLVGGGLALQAGKEAGEPIRTFALLFLAAALSRALSARFLAAQAEPPYRGGLNGAERAADGSYSRAFEATDAGVPKRILVYMLLVQAAVYVSGPYFTPYMLCQLRLSYTGWVLLTCTAYLAKVICLPAFGQVASRLGVHRLLWIGAVAITPVSALWLFSDSFVYLIGAQVFSGIAWAAYELATILLFVDAIPTSQRVRVLTLYNLGNAAAIFVGSMVGAGLLAFVGESRHAYLILFALSGVGRLATLFVLARSSRFTLRPQSMGLLGRLARKPSMAARQVLAEAVRDRHDPHPLEDPSVIRRLAGRATFSSRRTSLPPPDREELPHCERAA